MHRINICNNIKVKVNYKAKNNYKRLLIIKNNNSV